MVQYPYGNPSYLVDHACPQSPQCWTLQALRSHSEPVFQLSFCLFYIAVLPCFADCYKGASPRAARALVRNRIHGVHKLPRQCLLLPVGSSCSQCNSLRKAMLFLVNLNHSSMVLVCVEELEEKNLTTSCLILISTISRDVDDLAMV